MYPPVANTPNGVFNPQSLNQSFNPNTNMTLANNNGAFPSHPDRHQNFNQSYTSVPQSFIAPNCGSQQMPSQSQIQAPSLPPNWNSYSDAERTGILFRMSARNEIAMQTIIDEQREIRGYMREMSQRLNSLENQHNDDTNRVCY